MGAVENGTRVRPPSTGNANNVDLVAATATAAIATGLGAFSDFWISIVVNQPHNILFGDSDVAAPASKYVFPAGYVHNYELDPGAGDNTHFRVIASATAEMLWWASARP